MDVLSLQEIADITGGTLIGTDARVDGVGTDSRTVTPDMLFVALQGPNFDGHDFLPAVAERGAAGALVQRVVSDVALPQIAVADALVALQTLAATWRSRFRIPLVAVTGSCGKTTVKDMLAAIFRQAGPCLATTGNLNNHIGLPLTLLRLRPEHRFAVIEMGMNHPGEIALLTRLARPTVAIINNARPAHIGNFGTLEGIAAAKGEILEGLDAQGTAVLNGDDAFADFWARQAPGRVLRFGFDAVRLDLRGRWSARGEGGALWIKGAWGDDEWDVPLPGQHNGANALAAGAAALAVGLTLEQVRTGLAAMQASPGRSRWRPGLAGSRVLDDSYNANPASLEAALKVLAASAGEKIFVFGDMAELGVDEARLHEEVGRKAHVLGINRLLSLGELAALAAASFGAGGKAYTTLDALLAELRPLLNSNATVLVKGSRSARMERVVEKITG